jgi:hypothetical protein
MNPIPGRGRGFGRGLGRGFGWGRGFNWRAFHPYAADYGYSAPYPAYPERISPEEEAGMLAEEAKALERELELIRKRIGDLKAEAKR